MRGAAGKVGVTETHHQSLFGHRRRYGEVGIAVKRYWIRANSCREIKTLRGLLAELGYEATGQDFLFDMASCDGNMRPRVHDNTDHQGFQANSVHPKQVMTGEQEQTSSARKRKLSELADGHSYGDPPLSKTNQRTSSRDLMPPPLPKSKLSQQLKSPFNVQSRADGSLWGTPSQLSVRTRQENNWELPHRSTVLHEYGPSQSLPFRPSPSRMRQPVGQHEELDTAHNFVHRDQFAPRNIQGSHDSHLAPRLPMASPANHRRQFAMPDASRTEPSDSRVLPRRNPYFGTTHHGEGYSNDYRPLASRSREPLQTLTSSQLNRLLQRNVDDSHHTPRSGAGVRRSGGSVTSPFFREDGLPDLQQERPPTRRSMIHSSLAGQNRDYRSGLDNISTPVDVTQPTLNGLSFIDYPHRPSDHQPLYSSPSRHGDMSHHNREHLAPSSRDPQGLFHRPQFSRSSAGSRAGDRLYLTDPRTRISFAPSQARQVSPERILSNIRGVRGVNSQGAPGIFSRTRPIGPTGHTLPQAGSRNHVYR